MARGLGNASGKVIEPTSKYSVSNGVISASNAAADRVVVTTYSGIDHLVMLADCYTFLLFKILIIKGSF